MAAIPYTSYSSTAATLTHKGARAGGQPGGEGGQEEGEGGRGSPPPSGAIYLVPRVFSATSATTRMVK